MSGQNEIVGTPTVAGIMLTQLKLAECLTQHLVVAPGIVTESTRVVYWCFGGAEILCVLRPFTEWLGNYLDS